ncbi:MAG: PASTA domain-containing protein [Myxococcota bacterium]
MNDSFKMFVIAVVTAVATQLLLAPYILKLQGFEPTGTVAPAATAPATAPQPVAAPAGAKLSAPNVEGLSVDAARERWRAKDITIIEDGVRTDSGAKAGTILQQRPAPGEALDSKEIRVTVAQAGEPAQVPDVMGKALADARTELVAAGFEVPEPINKTVEDATPAGTVLAMEPNAGAQTTKGAVVRLTVAQPKMTAVPKVTGMYLSKAKAALTKAGLTVGKIRRVEHTERGGGYVLKQDPEEGGSLAPGGAVALTVVAPN